MKRVTVIAALASAAAFAQQPAATRDTAPRIRITGGAVALTVTLERSAASADLLTLLPLSLAAEDYAGKEKIAYLPRRLNTTGAPAGATPAAGELHYYAPWGNLAMYYEGAPYADGLVRLGRIDPGGVEALRKLGARQVTIERVD